MSYRVRYERKVRLGEGETETWALEQSFDASVPKPDAFRMTRDVVLRAIEESRVIGAPAAPEAKPPKVKVELTEEDIEGLGWRDYPIGGQWILIDREGDAAKRLAEKIHQEGKDGVLFRWNYRFSLSGDRGQFIRRVPVKAGAR